MNSLVGLYILAVKVGLVLKGVRHSFRGADMLVEAYTLDPWGLDRGTWGRASLADVAWAVLLALGERGVHIQPDVNAVSSDGEPKGWVYWMPGEPSGHYGLLVPTPEDAMVAACKRLWRNGNNV